MFYVRDILRARLQQICEAAPSNLGLLVRGVATVEATGLRVG